MKKGSTGRQANDLPLLISVITPSFNSAATLERTIKSVSTQDYPHFEHIVVDGGSTDGTLDVLQRYPAVRWISEPDGGQADAMNKGFAIARGEAVVYLNADDYFLEGAFSAVAPLLRSGAKMVMGKVKVLQENNQTEWINDPKTDLDSMLRHWELDAFCVNSVGYFYRREVQEAVPFNPENDDKMDLEFLIEVARQFEIKKIDRILGVFNYAARCKTGREQVRSDYWRPANFPFVERALASMPEEYQRNFRRRQETGYQLRRWYTLQGAKTSGKFDAVCQDWKLVPLPRAANANHCAVADTRGHAAGGDSVVILLERPTVCSRSLVQTIRQHAPEGQCLPVYQTELFSTQALRSALELDKSVDPRFVTAHALRRLFDTRGGQLNWKFVAGVQDPITSVIERYRSQLATTRANADHKNLMELIENEVAERWAHFQTEYGKGLGINWRDHESLLDHGYRIIRRGNVEVLIYKAEGLSACVGKAMDEFLGLCGARLGSETGTGKRELDQGTSQAHSELRFPREFLERLYAGEYCRTFYSGEERACFIRRWMESSEQKRAAARRSSGRWSSTIYDVGMHKGEDAKFYLMKGFRVVAIEADPTLCETVRSEFREYIRSGQLEILNVGITEKAGEEVFYLNRSHPEWSSFLRNVAERDGCKAEAITVPCRRLSEIVIEQGDPYYIKIDIEGHDFVALWSLKEEGIRANYISVENGSGRMLKTLVEMGYTAFQYVQQRDIPSVTLPNPAMEGRHVDFKFPFGASGPFGRELGGQWMDENHIAEVISKYWEPETGRPQSGYDDRKDGWFDLHARKG